jgi:FkbM family methyltransferase
MLQALRRGIIERARCAKHNWLDGVAFRVSYARGVYTVRTREGFDLRFPINPYLSFFQIEGYLRKGAWTVSPGETVVDAGACLGEFALYAAALAGPAGRVIVFEPDPVNLKGMREAFALNPAYAGTITVLEEGLWKDPGHVEFNTGLGAASGIAGVGHGGAPVAAQAAATRLPVRSLDSLAASHGLSRLDFVKMDIEGAEIEAVEGADDVIRRFRPRFAIASYHLRDGRPTSEQLEVMFRDRGYQAESGFEVHRTTYAAEKL